MQISKNFSYEEFTKSATAQRYGIDNTPSLEVRQNIETLVHNIMQPIREKYGKPIIITSGYRCEKLNKLVGGAANSAHKYGAAVDFHSLSDSREDNKRLYNLIKDMINGGEIEVRSMINEYNYDWIHIDINDPHLSKRKNYIFAIN